MAMALDADLLGFIAAFCTTFSFVPQVLLVWRRRSGEGISTGMYLIFSLGVFLWLCYGVLTNAGPVIAANAVTLLLALCVLAMKWRFGRARPRC
ncbi:SemiSWEET transporter [Massilia sp. erpn]|uniref:SemiSWEET transporter n=1 Tax=Massilia sp. erpn TaxID=2738142 RepID=UPI0027D9AEB2|nr:SemiSWEET transporter [Massilia sp. erpn]